MNFFRKVMLINCFDTYEHRVEFLAKYFRDRDCEVRVITSDWHHIHKTVRIQCPKDFEMLHVRPYTRNLSADRLLSHHRFAMDAFSRAQEFEPDLLWVLVPPNSLVKQADEYKKRNPGTKLVMDVIDMWPETMPISRFKTLPPFSFWKDLRDRHLKCADVVVTECDLYQQALRVACSGKKMHTLYLARNPAQNQSGSLPVLPEDRVVLCYLGSINNIIDIPCIARIISSIEGAVELHIVGDGEKRQELIDVAAQAGADVIYHGKVYDPKKKQEIFNRCHFGLNIMKKSVFVGLTMKSMDYFEGGLPIINNIRGDTWNFVRQNEIGINYSEGEPITSRMIAQCSENRDAVRRFFMDRFTGESFEKQLNKILEDLI